MQAKPKVHCKCAPPANIVDQLLLISPSTLWRLSYCIEIILIFILINFDKLLYSLYITGIMESLGLKENMSWEYQNYQRELCHCLEKDVHHVNFHLTHSSFTSKHGLNKSLCQMKLLSLLLVVSLLLKPILNRKIMRVLLLVKK